MGRTESHLAGAPVSRAGGYGDSPQKRRFNIEASMPAVPAHDPYP